jgi:hypothetical protein
MNQPTLNRKETAMQTSESSLSLQDSEYADLLKQVQKSFELSFDCPLFRTDLDNTFNIYLNSIPVEFRQHYNCRTCAKFFRWFGSIVTVNQFGEKIPLFWSWPVGAGAGTFFSRFTDNIREAINSSRIVDTLEKQSALDLGIAQTGNWSHFAVRSEKIIGGPSRKHDFMNVSRALACWDKSIVDKAVSILNSDALYRGSAVIGQAQWLQSLYGLIKDQLWKAVAEAPEGFCHPQSSMLGTLLDDIRAGRKTDVVAKKFAEKMRPDRYQRPTAAPSDQTILQAEKVIEELGASGSLRRRFLRPSEVNAVWRPAEKQKLNGGVFDCLKGGTAISDATNDPVDITWVKFRDKVMPTAESMKVVTPRKQLSFCSLVTAVNPDAPPILQWDTMEHRNPVSWYCYLYGATPSQFGVPVGRVPVTSVTLLPHMWSGNDSHHAKGVVFTLEGCKDTLNKSLGLFPSFMKSQFHGIRSVIEAYSAKNTVEDDGGPAAAGIVLQEGCDVPVDVEVESCGQKILYRIDRWD